ncbi:peptidylprolyl isomerase [Oceanicoccus sp. KOV_DT_Chl]|uniref:FKBP-type peptidyl-prolyl cis-trans isomerase n=1 Tax=Oceanicoccus sp. KOV_DT_Chl TaxID=1904639 RepID=UPI000C7CA7A2|nr:peptidylprolyl isomerase [Oceanicoccus sp. KOV_DT_Chl]
MSDSSEKISANKVVSFHYTLFNSANEQLETTRDGEPTLFLVGADNVLPSVEQAMMGKAVGDSFTINLAAVMAYGLRDENKKDRISAKYLKHEGKLKPGQIVRIDTEQGRRTATVIKVGKFSVDIDLNHPLAGQDIRFDVEIMAVRDGTQDEIAHGHAHGVGGHHH